MATTDAQSQTGEVSQQSTNKWQKSTKDIWRRSTQAWSDSRDRYHQATMEAWHRSSDSLTHSMNRYEQGSTDAWHRSTNSLTNSKERCQQSTVDAWQRSTNSWKNSKARYRQSTADMLNRSAIKLYQSTDRLQRLPHTQTKTLENQAQTSEASESTPSLPSSLHHQTSLPTEPFPQGTQPSEQFTSPNPSQRSQPPQPTPIPESTQSPQSPQSSSESSQSPTSSSNASQPAHAPSETSTESIAHIYQMIDPSSKEEKQDQQIRLLLNMTDQTFFQLHQAKQLRNSKANLLGEIEHQWINSTINDALRSGQSLVKLLEPHRLDMVKRKGKISSSNKKRWKLEDCRKAQEKQSKLILHQERLDKVFSHLKNLSMTQEDASVSSPESQQSQSESIPELEATRTPVPELSGDTELIIAPVELPSDSTPKTIIAELPGDATIPAGESPKPVPKIIITRTPENISVEYIGSPATPDQPKHENNEMNEILGWKETRNDVRLHQSTSLSNIIAEMDNARIK